MDTEGWLVQGNGVGVTMSMADITMRGSGNGNGNGNSGIRMENKGHTSPRTILD